MVSRDIFLGMKQLSESFLPRGLSLGDIGGSFSLLLSVSFCSFTFYLLFIFELLIDFHCEQTADFYGLARK